jgi:hypothetical protein
MKVMPVSQVAYFAMFLLEKDNLGLNDIKINSKVYKDNSPDLSVG